MDLKKIANLKQHRNHNSSFGYEEIPQSIRQRHSNAIKKLTDKENQWKMINPHQEKTTFRMKTEPFEPKSKQDNKNLGKLKQLDELKTSNLDELNTKITNLIKILSIQEQQQTNKLFCKKANRVKTEYDDRSYKEEDSIKTRHYVDKSHHIQSFKKLEESYINSIFDDVHSSNVKKDKKKKDLQLEIIKKKYNKKQGQKSENGSSSNSKAQQLNKSINIDADIIRFRQKLKENNQRSRIQINKQLNLNLKFNKDELSKSNKKYSKIMDDMNRYQQKINGYSQVKESYFKVQKRPLQDITAINSQSISFKLEPKIQIKQKNSFYEKPTDNFEQPLTADFRIHNTKSELILFLQNLLSQIKLDRRFCEAKQWFSQYYSIYKWAELQKALKSRGIILDESSVTEIFSVRDEEQNPFYSNRPDSFDVSQLVEIFTNCQEHWFEFIIKKYNRQRLLSCGLSQKRLDISHKGYIDVQDLVRLINLELDERIRLRDMYLIFERMLSQDYLTFSAFLEVICQ